MFNEELLNIFFYDISKIIIRSLVYKKNYDYWIRIFFIMKER